LNAEKEPARSGRDRDPLSIAARERDGYLSREPRAGAQMLSTDSWRERHRVRAVDETWQGGSGLGFDFLRFENRTWVGTGGGYPGNTTHTLFQVNDKVGVIVLTNTNDSDPRQIAEQLIATVGAAVLKAAPTRTQTIAWDPSWARFAGWYRNAGGDSRVVLLYEKLVMMSPTSTTVGTPSTLEPLGGGRFRLMAPGGGNAIGEVVRFVEESGTTARLWRTFAKHYPCPRLKVLPLSPAVQSDTPSRNRNPTVTRSSWRKWPPDAL